MPNTVLNSITTLIPLTTQSADTHAIPTLWMRKGSHREPCPKPHITQLASGRAVLGPRHWSTNIRAHTLDQSCQCLPLEISFQNHLYLEEHGAQIHKANVWSYMFRYQKGKTWVGHFLMGQEKKLWIFRGPKRLVGAQGVRTCNQSGPSAYPSYRRKSIKYPLDLVRGWGLHVSFCLLYLGGFFWVCIFLGPHLRHMQVSRLGVQWEL